MELTRLEACNEHQIKEAEDEIKRLECVISQKIHDMPKWYQAEREIRAYLAKQGYSQTVKYIVNGYKEKYFDECYISATTEWTVSACITPVKYLYEIGYLEADREVRGLQYEN